ncbi:hypothetical protein I79_016354 [Cricetulus griseus]|uniref:Uncharacterized protein n=1 Tax=Cricetulus griseus TaxID=10029 RepID=G3HZ59_CRIGR|nr:hypothetical protein I79_016354 [Cricetulus griseus]
MCSLYSLTTAVPSTHTSSSSYNGQKTSSPLPKVPLEDNLAVRTVISGPQVSLEFPVTWLLHWGLNDSQRSVLSESSHMPDKGNHSKLLLMPSQILSVERDPFRTWHCQAQQSHQVGSSKSLIEHLLMATYYTAPLPGVCPSLACLGTSEVKSITEHKCHKKHTTAATF